MLGCGVAVAAGVSVGIVVAVGGTTVGVGGTMVAVGAMVDVGGTAVTVGGIGVGDAALHAVKNIAMRISVSKR